jgi:hypothetical protein
MKSTGYQGIRLPGSGYQDIRALGLKIASFLFSPDVLLPWYPAS